MPTITTATSQSSSGAAVVIVGDSLMDVFIGAKVILANQTIIFYLHRQKQSQEYQEEDVASWGNIHDLVPFRLEVPVQE